MSSQKDADNGRKIILGTDGNSGSGFAPALNWFRHAAAAQNGAPQRDQQ
jgi:hypothetical protein